MNKHTNILQRLILVLILPTVLFGCSKHLEYTSISTKEKCDCKKGAYWYQEKCWRNYEDEAIAISAIDSVVAVEMAIAEKSIIRINDQAYPIAVFLPMPEEKEFIILTEYEGATRPKSLISEVPIKMLRKKSFSSQIVQLNGSILDGTYDSIPLGIGSVQYTLLGGDDDDEPEEITATGSIVSIADSSDTLTFSFNANTSMGGMGNSKLVVIGKEAHLSGDLGTKTYHQISKMLAEHPEVETLVLLTSSGSVNDAVNMHTGRIVHEAGLTTKILKDSDIASGAVDLFCAGKERIVEKGAKIGIHSWCCLDDLTAIEIPKDHPAHKDQLDYFTLVMGPELGPAFYFLTIESAAFDGIYWMTDAEIKHWKVATQFIEEPENH